MRLVPLGADLDGFWQYLSPSGDVIASIEEDSDHDCVAITMCGDHTFNELPAFVYRNMQFAEEPSRCDDILQMVYFNQWKEQYGKAQKPNA